MNNLAEHIAQSVLNFRLAVGLGEQSNAVHEQLYASESIELLTAQTHAEKADALADMAVVMAGHYANGDPFYDFENAINGLNQQAILNDVSLVHAFDIVMTSNMSKVCTKEYVNKTDAKYQFEGVRLSWIQRGSLWACYAADDYPDKPKGKLLKPVTYKEPDWSGDTWKLDNDEHWNPKEHLPPVDLALHLKLTGNLTVDAIRPSHIKSRSGSLGYWTVDGFTGDPIKEISNGDIIGWQYA
ncbi:MAG: hypothetical protein ACPG47_02130 [Leucothrix sp.]